MFNKLCLFKFSHESLGRRGLFFNVKYRDLVRVLKKGKISIRLFQYLDPLHRCHIVLDGKIFSVAYT